MLGEDEVMYISSVSRKFAPWFKQTITRGSYKGKDITITTNYIENSPSFKVVSIFDSDSFRECRKEFLLGKFRKVYDTVTKRKR